MDGFLLPVLRLPSGDLAFQKALCTAASRWGKPWNFSGSFDTVAADGASRSRHQGGDPWSERCTSRLDWLDDFKFQPRDLNNFGWEGLKGTAKSPPRSSPQCLIKSDVSIYLTHSKIPATTSCPRTRLGSAQKEAAAYFQPLNNMVHAMTSISHLLWVFRLKWNFGLILNKESTCLVCRSVLRKRQYRVAWERKPSR